MAYTTPEIDRRPLRNALSRLKRNAGVRVFDEVKLKSVDESSYLEFLRNLVSLNGVLFAVATDAGINEAVDIGSHQREQVEKITKNKPIMKYEEGRQALQMLADQVGGLAPQLYVQLHCQVLLIASIVHSGVLYFVQRFPKSLCKFRWRIDQKNSTKTDFEDAFVKVAPALLQTISVMEPMPMLEGADYSAFERFDYPEGEKPNYLKEDYGIDVESSLNIGKLILEDLSFEDSTKNHGVQVADLLASGLRRCLRKGFHRNDRVASLLGRLMVQGKRNRPPLALVGFAEAERLVSTDVSRIVRLMTKNSRGMLAR